MNKLATIALAAAALAALGTGCAPPNDSSVQVVGVCSPPEEADKCSQSSEKCDLYLTGWVTSWLTVGGADNGLGFFVEVRNQRLGNAIEGTTTNTADARIKHYDFTYSADGLPLPGTSYNPTWDTVPAEGSSTPFIPFIPFEHSAALQAALPAGGPTLVRIGVTISGDYVDGSHFETGPYNLTANVYNADFTVATCPTAGDVATYCPWPGQTSSFKCVTP